MHSLAADLDRVLARAARALTALSDESASTPLGPGKWTRKETLGHLIDSASNNHQRFVRVQREDGLSLPGYAQDEWVRVQGYRDRDWKGLVSLWQSFNVHLVGVLGRIPDGALLH